MADLRCFFENNGLGPLGVKWSFAQFRKDL
jgi:hypothetical protein